MAAEQCESGLEQRLLVLSGHPFRFGTEAIVLATSPAVANVAPPASATMKARVVMVRVGLRKRADPVSRVLELTCQHES